MFNQFIHGWGGRNIQRGVFFKGNYCNIYITYLYFIYSLDVSSLTLSLSLSLPSSVSLHVYMHIDTHTHTHTHWYRWFLRKCLKWIHCTGFPLIQKGRLPLPHDIHILELGTLETLRGTLTESWYWRPITVSSSCRVSIHNYWYDRSIGNADWSQLFHSHGDKSETGFQRWKNRCWQIKRLEKESNPWTNRKRTTER